MNSKRNKARIEVDESTENDFASLEGVNFIVESYQRGYRWERKQIEDLLNDINRFEPNDVHQYYCLQPLILLQTANPTATIFRLRDMVNAQPVEQRSTGWFELVDGQQRLTTLLLILIECDPSKAYFDIHYRNNRLIDRLYFQNAVQVIREWFGQNNDPSAKSNMVEKIKSRLLFILTTKKNGDKASETFVKLNSGKIPLTSAELFKAKLLSSLKGKQRIKVSMEWNQIEKALLDDEFWFFLGGDDHLYATKMDYLLRIQALSSNASKDVDSSDLLFAFHVFEQGPQAIDAWEEICETFDTLQSWHLQDDTYYYIGYLCASKKIREPRKHFSVAEFLASLLKISREERKPDFLERLISTIESQFDRPITDYKHGIDKGDDNASLHCLLLLFNLLSVKQIKNGPRFSFSSYHKIDSWDLEDIHATHEEGRFSGLTSEDRICYFREAIDLLERIGNHENEISILEQYISGNDADAYGSSLDALRAALPTPHPGNTIKNLCLLDSETNRSYGNKLFGVKRKILRDKVEKGLFLLPCTADVFLKAYTPSRNGENGEAATDINALVFSDEDAEFYLARIKAVLCRNPEKEAYVCIR